jgi:TolA-binding protein
MPRPRLAAVAVLLGLAILAAAAAPAGSPAPAPATSPSAAAPREDERPLDARTYFRGLELLRQAKRDEAIKTLRKVFTDFPDSPHAPAALLKVSDLVYPAASWEQIGSAGPEAIREAGELLTSLTQRYRSSREAPRALVKLGYLALEPSNPAFDLDQACGRFAAATQVYPDSDAADDAHFGSGMCESLRARPEKAADFFSRLLDENPASPLAAEALYRLGVALSRLGDPGEAMLTLQQVRARYPESRHAARALERITLLHRLRLQPAATPAKGPKPVLPGGDLYAYDDAYGGPAPARGGDATLVVRGANDIAIDPQGLAVLASPKAPGVFRLDLKGRVQERIAHPGPEYVAVGEGLAVYISGKEQIAVNNRNWSGPGLRGIDGRPPREYGPVAVDPSGRVYLLDPRDNVLLIFDRARRLVGNVRPPNREVGRFVDVAMGEDDGVYVLDGKGKMVVELHQGRQTRRIDLGPLGLQEPAAIAVDGLGDLFVLDGKVGWVTVTDPAGKRIAVVRAPKQVEGRLGDPAAVAVDAIGRIYLCGRRSGQVVRFR